jgi:hypothetical protein
VDLQDDGGVGEPVGEVEHVVTALDRGRPVGGQRLLAVSSADEVSGDRAGRVAVAAVVDREQQRRADIVRAGVHERAVDAHGERLLSDPTLPEAGQHLGARPARRRADGDR